MTCYTHWKTKGWKHTPIIWPNKRFCGQLVSYCCAEFPELGIINSWCFTCNRSFQPTLRMQLIMEVEDLTGSSKFMAVGKVAEDLVPCSASIMMGVHRVLSPSHVFGVLYEVLHK